MLSMLYSVFVIVLMTFSVRASNNMLGTMMPLLVKYDLNFSEIMIGLISALFTLSSFFMSGFINAALPPKERRVIFIFSSIVYAVIFPFFAFANGVSIWILSISSGFVLGALMPNIITSASLYPDRKTRERIVSLYTLTLSLSLIIGPSIESALLKFMNLRETFIFFTIFGLLTAVTSFFIKFPETEQKSKMTTHLKVIFKNPGFKASVINNLMYNVPFAMITIFGGIYAKETFHIGYSLITILFALFFLTSFLSRLILTIRPPQNLSFQMIISAILTALGLILIVFSNNIILYAIAFLILGIPHGLTYPLSLLAITRAFPPELRNKANSYFLSILSAIGAFIPIIFGFVIQYFGMRITFALIVIFVLLLLIFLVRNTIYAKNFESQ